MSGREDESEGEDDPREAVVLDYLAHGRSDDDRPRYRKSPLAYALGVGEFRLYELTLERGSDPELGIGDRVVVAPGAERPAPVTGVAEVDHGDLSGGARSELEYAVGDVVEADERRFVDFYNDAQPVTLRLHQLNLLPGVGDKIRDGVLDERKRGRFESFADVEDRVKGLHDPKGVIVDRIMEELTEDDLKYRSFVRRGDRN